GGDAPRGRLPDPLGLPDQLVVGRAAPGGRFGPLRAGGPLRLLLRGGRSRGVALLLLLAAATAEPVGLQRVVQRGTAVAGTGRRGQGLRLAPDRPLLRGRRTRGAEVGPTRAVHLRTLELAGGRRVRGTLPLRQGVPPGGAAALARRGELAGRGVVVALRRGELTRLRRVRPALLVRRSAEDVTPHVRAAVLPAVRTGPLELAGVLAAVRAGPLELAGVLRVRAGAVDARHGRRARHVRLVVAARRLVRRARPRGSPCARPPGGGCGRRPRSALPLRGCGGTGARPPKASWPGEPPGPAAWGPCGAPGAWPPKPAPAPAGEGRPCGAEGAPPCS